MNGLSPSIRGRLEHQLDAIALIVDGVSASALRTRPKTGKWSAQENLAHLVRHHRVMKTRIQRILSEERPRLPSYKAEDDPEWGPLSAAETGDVLEQLRASRAELKDLVLGLSPQQVGRTGIHPGFGEMTIAQWLEFFLLHEAHHLYVAMNRARGRE